LTFERATNLIFVYTSLHLREKLFDVEYKEEFVEWIDEDE
jgi:hypothetical protein